MPDEIRVLYVDDNEAGLAARADILHEHDRLSLTTATDIDTALAVVRERETDCIVCDYRVPSYHGFAFLRAVRQVSHVPFILLTRELSSDALAEAMDAGVTDYVPKSLATTADGLLADRICRCVGEDAPANAQSENFGSQYSV
jgi:CheY-like chemotaxis protein